MYLPGKQDLSPELNRVFMDILISIIQMEQGGGGWPLGVEKLSMRISEAWQNAHYNLQKEHPWAGLSGLMRPKHAKYLLFEKGKLAQAYQILPTQLPRSLPYYQQQTGLAVAPSYSAPSAIPAPKKQRRMTSFRLHKNMTDTNLKKLRYRDLQVAIGNLGGTCGTMKKAEMELKIKRVA